MCAAADEEFSIDAENYRESATTLDKTIKAKISESAVRAHVNAALGEDDLKPISRSLYRSLLEGMARAVSDCASSNIDAFEFENLLDEALEVVSNLRLSLVEGGWRNKTLDFWDSYGSSVVKIKAGKVPYIDRSGIEGVVGEYLALPYRFQVMDRFLVHTLIATELYAFGDEMLNEKTFGVFPARSPLKQRHVLLDYLLGQLVNIVFFGAIGAAAFWARSSGWIGDTALGWAIAICVSLILLFGAISTLALPFAWRTQSQQLGRVVNLLSIMATVYTELKSDGPISAPYIRRRADEASEKGVVWPAPLFALLDDIIARSGRF